jgi:hypothetical protein
MRLDPQLDGPVVFFAHDHGLIFYIDFVFYMLRLNAQRYATETSSVFQIFENEDLADFRAPGFKAIFVVTVSTDPRNIPIKSVLDAATKLSKERGYNNFEATIIQTETCDFETERLAQLVPKDVRKVLLSVPTPAEDKMKAQLQELGLAPRLVSILSPN